MSNKQQNLDLPEFKHCEQCGKALPNDKWSRGKRAKRRWCVEPKTRRGGTASECQYQGWLAGERKRRKVKNGYAAHRDRSCKNTRYKRLYGITIDWYEEQYALRDGHCDICSGGAGSLTVDHDHKTGVIRGLLCTGCNKAIGVLGDSKRGLERALAYFS